MTRTSLGPGVGMELSGFKERESKPDSVVVHDLKEDGRAIFCVMCKGRMKKFRENRDQDTSTICSYRKASSLFLHTHSSTLQGVSSERKSDEVERSLLILAYHKSWQNTTTISLPAQTETITTTLSTGTATSEYAIELRCLDSAFPNRASRSIHRP